MKPKGPPKGVILTRWQTRNMPVDLLMRLYVVGSILNVTTEQAMNVVLERGLGIIEKTFERGS